MEDVRDEFGSDEFLDIFLEDADEQLGILNESLLALEEDRSNLEILDAIFRAAHNIKGVSAGMGFEVITDLTHSMEDVLDKMRSGEIQIDGKIIDVLFDCLDTLEKMIRNLTVKGQADVDVTDLMGKLEKLDDETQRREGIEARDVVEFEISEYEGLETQKAIEEGLDVYDITVTLEEKCRMKSTKAFLVYNNLEGLGEIIKIAPPMDEEEPEEV